LHAWVFEKNVHFLLPITQSSENPFYTFFCVVISPQELLVLVIFIKPSNFSYNEQDAHEITIFAKNYQSIIQYISAPIKSSAIYQSVFVSVSNFIRFNRNRVDVPDVL